MAVLAFSTEEALANFSNGPENPGPNVVRGEIDLGLFYADPKAGLLAIHGGDVVEFCETGSTIFPLFDFQNIISPSDADRTIELIHGDDIPTPVWPFAEFNCALFTTLEPIATGTVDLVMDVGSGP